MAACRRALIPKRRIAGKNGFRRDGTSTCSSTPDAGSAQASDPFLEYTFTQPGTYTVKVGAYVTYNAATDGLGVANTFLPSGDYGVQQGMHYALVLSLQHHATNPNALSLEGKRITVVSGPGEGQTALITSYDPEHGTYTLDTKWATARCVSATPFGRPVEPEVYNTNAGASAISGRPSTAPPRSTTRSPARWSCSASGRRTSGRCRSTPGDG